jgi:hypothetical protein
MADVAIAEAGVAPMELGTGRPVVALGAGFAGSAAHHALALRFRVIAFDGVEAQAIADWIAGAGLGGVGFLGIGPAAATALAAATAAAERARSVVLVSPGELPETDLKTPKAVLIGSLDSAQPRDALSRYRRALPRCSTVLVYGAGADIPADRPAAFADAAGDFLDRQERFALATESVALKLGA